jgi:hypothetical protein
MGFHMDVRVDKVFEEGSYRAFLENVEEKDTKYGARLMWTFRLVDESAEVVGFTSMSPSTKAKAYRWAEALTGEIDPMVGWGPEDVIGHECFVALKVAEDAQGVETNKVVEVKPLGKANGKSDDSGFEGTPF